MILPTTRTEGAILFADLLDTIAQGEGPGQQPTDFGLGGTPSGGVPLGGTPSGGVPLPKTAEAADDTARSWAGWY